jgi:asparagine synthase (glutamine-hydrolysing)
VCGIAGIFYFDGRKAEADLLKRMTDVIAHRGPDGEGHYVRGPVGLGHRRLSIIDLSASGIQPMSNEDGTIWITYNGEIYNFRELRKELEEEGHVFRSGTDTEVVIHAYEQWGFECLRRFNGMFAFGLWDEKKKALWLVRDRLGVKPLFYCHARHSLLFGSEIKSILSDPEVERCIDYEALAYYLALNYTPAPYTLFSTVRQILPGHYLIAEASGRVRDVEYWDLVFKEERWDERKEQAYVEEFSALLEDSIRLRLVSDVPFGAFLSGGIDSSTVAYWMSQHLSSPLKTFTIGFGEPSFDEIAFARETAKRIGAEHHERIVRADATAMLPKLVWHAEEPTADSSMVAMYYLAEETRKAVKMVLSGDGADEILAGYETYQAYYLLRIYRVLPAWLRRSFLKPLLNLLPVSDAKVSWDFKLRRFVKGAELNPEDAHATWRMIFDADARAKLLAPISDIPGVKADAIDLYRRAFSQTNAKDPLNRMLYVDTRLYLPNDMLVKVDRMTMAHGLEAREPFLDYRLVEYAASLPSKLKLRNFGHKKYLLKASMEKKLPRSVIRRKKEGFNVPNARWIRKDLKSVVNETLSSRRIRQIGILDSKVVNGLLKEHLEKQADHSHHIWCLLTLVLWWAQYIEGREEARLWTP